MNLQSLFLVAVATIGFMGWIGHHRAAGWFGVIAYALQLGLLLSLQPLDVSGTAPFSIQFLEHTIAWKMSGIGWFFACITVGIALFCSWFMVGEYADRQNNMKLQQVLLALNVFSMLILLASDDFLSLFIGWELVSWASFLIMTQRGGRAADAAFRYLMYAMGGAMAILAGIVIIYLHTHSFAFADFWQIFPTLPQATVWTVVVLFVSGFAVKMAIMPFHLWQADAYAETPGASAAFISAISARMGLFALAVVLLQPVGIAQLVSLHIPFTFLNMQDVLLWLAVLTAIIPTFIALQQSDARLLLAWHGIGQGGLMLLGLALGTQISVAGGLLHVFNYATYQAALFLAITAVYHRTGTTDLDRLGGLIVRMPWTYLALLMGIIGLAGLPPMNGFVSKWLLYKSTLMSDMPLLLIAASISTLGTILSVYKLIHNIFLGQLRKEHYDLKEAPWTMTVPMLSLGFIGFITGMMPGLALDFVDTAQISLGYTPLAHHLGGVQLASGGLNMLWVTGIFFYGVGIGAIIFFLGNRRFITHQWDNYAGGHFLTSDTPYNYTHNFYPGVMRVIGGGFRGWIVSLEQGITSFAWMLASIAHGMYRVSSTPLYLLMITVFALSWMLN